MNSAGQPIAACHITPVESKIFYMQYTFYFSKVSSSTKDMMLRRKFHQKKLVSAKNEGGGGGKKNFNCKCYISKEDKNNIRPAFYY
jgi:hypothetical protein